MQKKSRHFKLALIGNMNNNNFSLLRYFRDAGVDAHLLLYSNDGKASCSHFKPQDDTFNYSFWKPYIHRTSLYNGAEQALPSLLFLIFYSLNKIRSIILRKQNYIRYISKNYLRKLLDSYDGIITSGYALSIISKIGVNVDIYYPYATGIEGIRRYKAMSSDNIISRLIFEYGRKTQIRSLKCAKNIFNADMGQTKLAFNSLNIPFYKIPVPMVYRESFPKENLDSNYNNIRNILQGSDFSIMMHSRLAWKTDTCIKHKVDSKNNHWLIHAFKSVLQQFPGKVSKLVILEYGPDIKATKELVNKLNLSNHTIWLKQTSRKNLMWLLQYVSLGVGEFQSAPGTIWGGTGWEVLCMGKPLLQRFLFEDGEFEKIFGFPEPPILKVRTRCDIKKHLISAITTPTILSSKSQASYTWFNHYNGKKLANEWLKYLKY